MDWQLLHALLKRNRGLAWKYAAASPQAAAVVELGYYAFYHVKHPNLESWVRSKLASVAEPLAAAWVIAALCARPNCTTAWDACPKPTDGLPVVASMRREAYHHTPPVAKPAAIRFVKISAATIEKEIGDCGAGAGAETDLEAVVADLAPPKRAPKRSIAQWLAEHEYEEAGGGCFVTVAGERRVVPWRSQEPDWTVRVMPKWPKREWGFDWD